MATSVAVHTLKAEHLSSSGRRQAVSQLKLGSGTHQMVVRNGAV